MLSATLVCPARPRGGITRSVGAMQRLVRGCGVGMVTVKGKATSERSRRVITGVVGGAGMRCVVIGRTNTSMCSTSRCTSRRFPSFSRKREDTISVTEELRSPLTRLMGVSPGSVKINRCRRSVGRGRLARSLAKMIRGMMGRIKISLGATSMDLLGCMTKVKGAATGGVVGCERRGKDFGSEGRLLGIGGLNGGACRRYTKFVGISGPRCPLSGAAVRPRSCSTACGLLRGLGCDTRSVKDSGLGLSGVGLRRVSRRLSVKRRALGSVVGRLGGPNHSPHSSVPGPVLEGGILSVRSLRVNVVVRKAIEGVISFKTFISVKIRRSKLIRVSRLITSGFMGRPLSVIDIKSVISIGILSMSLGEGEVGLSVVLWCCVFWGRCLVIGGLVSGGKSFWVAPGVVVVLKDKSSVTVTRGDVGVLRGLRVPCDLGVTSTREAPSLIHRVIVRNAGTKVRMFVNVTNLTTRLPNTVTTFAPEPIVNMPMSIGAENVSTLRSVIRVPCPSPVTAIKVSEKSGTTVLTTRFVKLRSRRMHRGMVGLEGSCTLGIGGDGRRVMRGVRNGGFLRGSFLEIGSLGVGRIRFSRARYYYGGGSASITVVIKERASLIATGGMSMVLSELGVSCRAGIIYPVESGGGFAGCIGSVGGTGVFVKVDSGSSRIANKVMNLASEPIVNIPYAGRGNSSCVLAAIDVPPNIPITAMKVGGNGGTTILTKRVLSVGSPSVARLLKGVGGGGVGL